MKDPETSKREKNISHTPPVALPPRPDLYCKIKADTSSILVTTGSKETSSRLVHNKGTV